MKTIPAKTLIYAKKAKTPIYAKKAKPPKPLDCNWWQNQKVVEPYRGVAKHSFNLRSYGNGWLSDYVSIPGQEKHENALASKIYYAIQRVKNALKYAPQYFNSSERDDILKHVKASEQYWDKIGPIYNEWANKPYPISGYKSTKAGNKMTASGNIMWPLDESLWNNLYLQDLYSNKADVEQLGIGVRVQWVKLWSGSPRIPTEMFTNHFEDWAQQLGTLAVSRLQAIQSVRTAYKMAAHEVRCAEVLTARAISYARNKAAFISGQR